MLFINIIAKIPLKVNSEIFAKYLYRKSNDCIICLIKNDGGDVDAALQTYQRFARG